MASLEERHDGVVDALDVAGGDSDALLVDVERVGAADLVAARLEDCMASGEFNTTYRIQELAKFPLT